MEETQQSERWSLAGRLQARLTHAAATLLVILAEILTGEARAGIGVGRAEPTDALSSRDVSPARADATVRVLEARTQHVVGGVVAGAHIGDAVVTAARVVVPARRADRRIALRRAAIAGLGAARRSKTGEPFAAAQRARTRGPSGRTGAHRSPRIPHVASAAAAVRRARLHEGRAWVTRGNARADVVFARPSATIGGLLTSLVETVAARAHAAGTNSTAALTSRLAVAGGLRAHARSVVTRAAAARPARAALSAESAGSRNGVCRSAVESTGLVPPAVASRRRIVHRSRARTVTAGCVREGQGQKRRSRKCHPGGRGLWEEHRFSQESPRSRAPLDSRDGAAQSNACALACGGASTASPSTPVSRIHPHCLESRRSWARGDPSSRGRPALESTPPQVDDLRTRTMVYFAR